jgi:putative tryptophan/tyrosine transport system substrate-binding protein
MRRREFLSLLSGAAGWPLAARSQGPSMPVIGFLSSRSPGESKQLADSFRGGLRESDFREGQNVAIEYRWAEGHYDQLPELAADLVRRKVAAIFATGGNAPAQAAKAATDTIPIVFVSGGEPVRAGLVAALNRPGGNVTGVSFIASALVGKRLDLLHELTPKVSLIGVLVNPKYPDSDLQLRELHEVAETIKQQILVVSASTEGDIDTAFASLVQPRADALLVANDPFFDSRRDQITSLASRHAIPAIYPAREYIAAGGLMSYGSSLSDAYRQAGIYVGKILKGAKPAELPVLQPTTFELVINLTASKTLGITFPPSIMVRADEVIE